MRGWVYRWVQRRGSAEEEEMLGCPHSAAFYSYVYYVMEFFSVMTETWSLWGRIAS